MRETEGGGSGARRRGRKPASVMLTPADREVLERWARGVEVRRGLARRARIVLACAAGESNQVVAADLSMSAHAVGRWRARFSEGGVAALMAEGRPGAPVQVGRDLARVGPDAVVSGVRISASSARRASRAAALRPGPEGGTIPEGAVLVGVHVFGRDHAFVLAARKVQETMPAPEEQEEEPQLSALEERLRQVAATLPKPTSPVRLRRFLKRVDETMGDAALYVVVDQAPPSIARRWILRRASMALHVTGTRHAWWSLLGAWWRSAPSGRDGVVLSYLEDAASLAEPFEWLAAGDP